MASQTRKTGDRGSAPVVPLPATGKAKCCKICKLNADACGVPASRAAISMSAAGLARTWCDQETYRYVRLLRATLNMSES